MPRRYRTAKPLLGLAMAEGVGLVLAEAAYACDRCFGAAAVDSPVTEGIGLAMLSLMGMTALVMGGVVLFFVNVQKRARRLAPGGAVVTEDGEVLLSDEPG